MEVNLKKKLEAFFSGYNLVKYRKGEIILRPGEKPNYIGFIKSGFVRMYTLSENGQEVTVQFFKPIFYFTMIFAALRVENRFYFEAMTPVEMYQAPIKDAMEFLEKNKEEMMTVFKIIMLTFIDLIDQVGVLLSGNAYNKVAAIVLSLSKRTEKEGAVYSKIDFGITHKLIASLTGLTRETVTLQMLRLEKEGLINNKSKRVEIIDLEGLIKAAKIEG
jgi:CRP/FNR family transcriptional regulator, cyclic AMP receptor protein